jgi:hypothetical protein
VEFNLKNWGMMLNKNKYFKYCVLYPIAFLWDMVYYIISKVYHAATWIDKNGGNYLESKFK